MRVATREKTQSRLKAWGARLAGAGVAAAMAVGVAASPALAAAVTPVLLPNQNPPQECPDTAINPVALRVFPSATNPQQFLVPIPNDGNGSITVTFSQVMGADPNTQVAFTTSGGVAVSQVTVKGGDNANRYFYNAQTGFPNGLAMDSGLISPLNNGGQLPTISHVDFCFVESPYNGGA
ncbi:hypothetical protein ABZ484_05530 [Streptomyces sp. NPDC006393]|uniref:hypothetical protein n=1 Tax=Streptomyces sp. NPDC006393 TaxID=3156763 RepID=UPI0033C63376